MKIGLVGCPGTGRTTVAMELSNTLGISFVSSKSITQKITQRDGYIYSPNHFVEYFLAVKSREFELVNARIAAEAGVTDFITDRTTLEQFAYALLRLDTYSTEDINKLREICCDNMNHYTHIFYFPRVNEIKENGLRTSNYYFQTQIDYVIQGLLKEWNIPVINMKRKEKNPAEFIAQKVRP